jgi:predicted RNA-binding Zn ribbon-like protein
MSFEWTAHRFSGGLLALDLVNTVVCRNQPALRTDRLSSIDAIQTFCEAAGRFRPEDAAGGLVFNPSATAELVELREAVDGWLRPIAGGRQTSAAAIERLFSAAASCVRRGQSEDGRVTLGSASAICAMKLFGSPLEQSVKSCPNCDWLFVDRSKNRSRVWCDMRVCGNRAKAGNHYQKLRNKTLVAGEFAK